MARPGEAKCRSAGSDRRGGRAFTADPAVYGADDLPGEGRVDGRPPGVGVAERGRIHPVREAALLVRDALTFRVERLPQIIGNHVIVRSGDVYAAVVHLAPGSVCVRDGQALQTGEVIGRASGTSAIRRRRTSTSS